MSRKVWVDDAWVDLDPPPATPPPVQLVGVSQPTTPRWDASLGNLAIDVDALVAGCQVGDLAVMVRTFDRTVGNAHPPTYLNASLGIPAKWMPLGGTMYPAQFRSAIVAAKRITSPEPSVNFQFFSMDADNQYHVSVWRNAGSVMAALQPTNNGSGFAFPGLDAPRDGCASLALACTADNSSSVPEPPTLDVGGPGYTSRTQQTTFQWEANIWAWSREGVPAGFHTPVGSDDLAGVTSWVHVLLVP